MPLIVGIDLGTTNSCLAVYRNGTVEIIESKELQKTIPSFVFYNDSGEVVVGKQAFNKSILYPPNGVYDSKRMIGCKFNDEHLAIRHKLYPFKVIEGKNGECEIIVTTKNKETHLRPEEVSAEILMELKRNAEEKLKEKIVNVVITVPAYFNNAQKQATKDAAEIAGLHVMKLITEPVAAALAFIHNVEWKKNKTILVYDLGGGTFDVSLIKLSSSKNKIEVIAVSGDNFIGGRDFDQNLLEHIVMTEMRSENSETLTELQMRRARRRLQTQCEELKKNLTNSVSTEIELFELNPDTNSHVEIQITRETFEKINMKLFQRTIDIMDRLLIEAKMSKKQIDEVLLVGGSTRIPKIEQLVSDYFNGKKLNNTVNPDEAVAIGATIQAALLSEDPVQKAPKYILTDVIPRSLGIEVLSENTMNILIERNTKIPCIAEKIYFTCVDYQPGVTIRVFEGESSDIRKNVHLGEFVINGLTPMPAGQVKISVRFQIHVNGLLKVTATENSKNKSGDLNILLNNGRLTKKEKEEALNRNSRKF